MSDSNGINHSFFERSKSSSGTTSNSGQSKYAREILDDTLSSYITQREKLMEEMNNVRTNDSTKYGSLKVNFEMTQKKIDSLTEILKKETVQYKNNFWG